MIRSVGNDGFQDTTDDDVTSGGGSSDWNFIGGLTIGTANLGSGTEI